MALAKRQTNITRALIIGVVIILVGGVGYLLFQKYFIKTGPPDQTNINAIVRPAVSNFGESILTDSRFTALQPFDVPLDVNQALQGAGQAANPFR